MRADTKRKHEMGKRFTILICVAAAGVMALGAQTGTAASEGVVEYKTTLTIFKDWADLHGQVRSKQEVQGWARGDRVQEAARAGSQARRYPKGSQRVGVHNWWVRVKGLKGQGPGRPASVASMPRRRPRWAMGSCAAATSRGSSPASTHRSIPTE